MGSTVSHIDQADYPAAQGVALQLNSDWTLGPLFFGWTANVFLCGVTVSWFAGYWRRAKGDKWTVKSAVLVAACSEVVTAILNLLVRGPLRSSRSFAS
jgi:riboflavin transporter FmnP